MKKFLAILCAAAMLFSFSATAFAATETTSLDYSMIDADVYDGAWYTLADVLDFYLPTDWYCVDLENSDYNDSVLYVTCDEDEEHFLYLQHFTADEVTEMVGSSITDSQALTDELLAEGYDDARVCNINDIETVIYTDTENDQFCVMIVGDQGGIFKVSFNGVSDEDYQAYIANMVVSMSVPEE